MVCVNCALKIASLHSNESEKPDGLEKHARSVKRGLLGKESDSKSRANERRKSKTILQESLPICFFKRNKVRNWWYKIGGVYISEERHAAPAEFDKSCQV